MMERDSVKNKIIFLSATFRYTFLPSPASTLDPGEPWPISVTGEMGSNIAGLGRKGKKMNVGY